MKIKSFRIENYRNIRLVECSNIPDLMVICGPNGCGKSALLESIMLAKEIFSSYKIFRGGKGLKNLVSANASETKITLEIEFSDEEGSFVRKEFHQIIPKNFQIYVEFDKKGKVDVRKYRDIKGIETLLKYYSSKADTPGFFDFISAERRHLKTEVDKWNPSAYNDNSIKETLVEEVNKFQFTKYYLTSLKMRDLQNLQKSRKNRNLSFEESLKEIKHLFDRFFTPMKFEDVDVFSSPFKFIISTPSGNIDIDDLSSGEKEILNVFVRFHQLKPIYSVILFDEIDAHLHPEFAKRYFKELTKLSETNQMIITTHSPEIMMVAPKGSLYTLIKYPLEQDMNQLRPIVTEDEELFDALSDLMGSRGYLSFNNKIVFIEGVEASADKLVYELLFPPEMYNISFVPAGSSYIIKNTAEQVNKLLSSSTPFQGYFSIIDGDMERCSVDPSGSERLFRLPVYHIENFLLNNDLIFEVIKIFMSEKCPYTHPNNIEEELKTLILTDQHLNPYTRTLFNNKLTKIAIESHNSILKQQTYNPPQIKNFEDLKEEAKDIMEKSINDGTWHQKCKGRAILRALCGKNNINYEHFRNSLIKKMESPPAPLIEIIDRINQS